MEIFRFNFLSTSESVLTEETNFCRRHSEEVTEVFTMKTLSLQLNQYNVVVVVVVVVSMTGALSLMMMSVMDCRTEVSEKQ